MEHLCCQTSLRYRAGLIGLAVLLLGLVLMPRRAAGQDYPLEPQAVIRPQVIDLALAAGENGTKTIILRNNGVEPLRYAFRSHGVLPGLVDEQGSGFTWAVSDEAGGPAFEWGDITAAGTRLDVGQNEAEAVPLPFSFPFFGVEERQVYVSANGLLTFRPQQAGRQLPTDLPDAQPPNAVVSPLWTAFSMNAGGMVHTYHDRAQQRFVVQYTEVPILMRGGGTFERFTFQVALYEDGTVVFYYLDVEPVAATIGVENEWGTEGLHLSFNEALLRDSTAVRLEPKPQYLQVAPAAGSVAPGGAAEVALRLDTRGLAPGVYRHTLQILTSDPRNPLVPIGVQLDVGNEAFPFRITPTTLEVPVRQGEQAVRSLTLENLDPEQAQGFRLLVQGGRTAPNTLRAAKNASPYAPPSVGFSTNAQGDHAFVSLDVQAPPALRVLAPSPVSYAGDFLYGDDARFAIITDEDNLFQTVEVESGRRTVRGTSVPADPGERWTGLAADPTDGTLYGSTTREGGSYLYRLDPETGRATRIAEMVGAPLVAGIAIDGQGRLYGVETTHDVLLRIDKRNGASAVVGSLGFDANFAQGLDVDLSTGTLYMTAFEAMPFEAQFRVVDMHTGRATLVAPFGEGVHLGYLALPSGSFVTAALADGRVPPGDQIDVALSFDARYLLAGAYEVLLKIQATDRAGAPSLSLPVRLDVRGDPRIDTPAPSSLPFSEVYVGDHKDRTLLLANRGFDVLEVTGVQFDHPAFSLTPSSQALLPMQLVPGAQQSLALRFAPSQAGVVQAHAFVESNDPATPTLTINLTGRAVLPPAIELTPERLALTAAAGRTHTRTFTLRNTGGSALTFVVEGDPQGLQNAVVPPLLAESFDAGLPAGWTVIDNAGGGVVWRPHTAYPPALRYGNYTGGGGTALMASSHASPGVAFDTEVRTPLLLANASNLSLAFRLNFVEAHAALSLDLSRDGGSTWTPLQQWTEDAGETFTEPGRSVQVDLAPYLREGDAFMLRWRYRSVPVSPQDFYAQIDAVRIGADVDALTFDLSGGTLAAGAAQEVTLSVDADGLLPGLYDASIRVRPATESTVISPQVVPLRVTIIAGALAQVAPAEAYPNETFVVPVGLVGPLDDLRDFAFELTYDPALLELLGLDTDETISDDASLAVDMEEPGRLYVATRAPLQPTGDAEGTLLRLRFRAKEQIGESLLAFPVFVLNDGALPATVQAGSLAVKPLYGDVTLDLDINVVDVAQVRTYTARYSTLSPASLAAADVTGDGRVDLADAALIDAYLDGAISCFPAESACEAGSAVQRYEAVTEAAKAEQEAPARFELGINYPNPSNPSTTIPYALPEAARVRVVVYNLLGQPVRVLVDGEQPAGRHTARWDGRNEAGSPVASGIYVYRLEAGTPGVGYSFVQTRPLTLVK